MELGGWERFSRFPTPSVLMKVSCPQLSANRLCPTAVSTSAFAAVDDLVLDGHFSDSLQTIEGATAK